MQIPVADFTSKIPQIKNFEPSPNKVMLHFFAL